MVQKLNDKLGNPVDFLKEIDSVEYIKLETYTHRLRSIQSQIDNTKKRVENQFGKKQFSNGDKIAENFIRKRTRAKEGVYTSRQDYLEGLDHAWKCFKKEVFGYQTITDAQKQEEALEAKEPKGQKKLKDKGQ